MKGSRGKIVSILLVWLMLIGGMGMMIDGSTALENDKGISSVPDNPGPMLISHALIRINNESDFANQAANEGWYGNGSESSPYIIENYDIDAEGGGNAIYIGNTTDYFVIRNCILHNASSQSSPYYSGAGVTLYNVQNGTVDNNIEPNNSYGICFYYSDNNNIANNTAESNKYYGIYLPHSSNNKISNNTATSNSHSGICLSHSSNNTIVNSAVLSNKWEGIYLSYSSNNTIVSNTASDNDNGIYLSYSSSNTIVNNTANSNDCCGVYLRDSSSNNNIAKNTASSNGYSGICLSESSSNTIVNNTASNNYAGIYLSLSSSNDIQNNTMMGNGIFIYGSLLSHWNTHTIDASNTVNGKPVYYWKNQSGGKVPSGAGEVILANCSNVVVESQNLSGGSIGLALGFSHGNTVENNTVSNNYWDGIYLSHSSSNTIVNNTALSNGGGIFLDSSSNNTITNNSASNNSDGILLSSSSNNTIENNIASDNNHEAIHLSTSSNNIIKNNTASNNYCGISLIWYSNSNTIVNNTISNSEWEGIYFDSSNNNNIIYHNNFINNTDQAYDSTDANFWNAPYHVGGNYWSDYSGIDLYKGGGQNISGSDGIGDSPYNIGGGAQDNYPLMYPFKGDGVNPITPYWHNILLNITAIAIDMEYVELWYTYASLNGSYGNYTLFANDTDPSDGWSWSFSLSDGEGWYSFYSIGGNTSSGHRDAPPEVPDAECGYDITPPSIGITHPYNGAITNMSSMTITWAGNDSLSGINHYEVRNDGGTWISVGTNTSYNFIGLSDGSHMVCVKAIDDAGNEATDSVSFTTDATGPMLTITSPEDGTITNSSNMTVIWSGSDATSGINHYEVRIDGGIWINVGTNTSYDFAGLSDDSHMVDVKAIDNLSNENTGSVTFIVDTICPMLTITSPEDGTITNSSNMTVTWNVSDATSGINHYEVRIDGGIWINVGTNTSYDFTGLSDGSHMVYVKAIDNAGNEATDSVSFTTDATGPMLTITSPEDGTITDSSSVTVTWNGSDATSGINHYEVRIDGGTWIYVGTNTSYDFTGISNGFHTVDVKAIDNVSNENTSSVTFTVDTIGPTLTITSPEDGTITDSSNITVIWNGSDATSGINHYEVRINGGTWIYVGTNTSYNFIGLSDGSHMVYVKAIDNLSNENTSSVTFTVDTIDPRLTITSPEDGTITNSSNMTVTWNGSDTTSGINHYEVCIDSGPWMNVGIAVSYDFTGLSDGPHTVDVKVVDNATNEATDSVTFTVDATAPAVSITAPTDGTIFAINSVTLFWTGSDATSGINHYEVRIDSGSWVNVGTNTTYDFIGLSDGSHIVDVKAVDCATNEATTSVGFKVDTTAPIVSITSPFGGTIFGADSVIVSWAGSDETSGIDHYEVSIDSGSWVNVGIAVTHDFTGLNDGLHSVDVRAVDCANNEATGSVTFTVDTTIPSVSITSPDEGGMFNTSSVAVSWAGSDETSGIGLYEVRVDSGSWFSVGTNNTYEFTNLSDGSHIVSVKAVDNASNEATDSVSFTVDVTVPDISIISPAYGDMFNASLVTVS